MLRYQTPGLDYHQLSLLNANTIGISLMNSTFSLYLNRSSGTSSEARTTGENRSTTTPATQGMPGMTGMLNSPGMQSLMQQIVDNPQLMQSMMNAPYVQSMFQQMGSNPQLAEQMILNNPLFASKILLFLFCN